MHLLSPSPLVELSYRSDLHILVLRWLGVAEDTEVKRIYGAIEAACEPSCRYWLIDARRRTSFRPVVTTWLFEEFVPRVAARFGGPLHLSYLVAPAHLAGAQEFWREHVAPAGAALPFRLHYASEEGEATNWLLQAQGAPLLGGPA